MQYFLRKKKSKGHNLETKKGGKSFLGVTCLFDLKYCRISKKREKSTLSASINVIFS